MASVTLLFIILMMTSVQVEKSNQTGLVKLKCQPAVGVIGQTTTISCSIEPQETVINAVIITRIGEKKPCFTFQPFENKVTGDLRFKVENKSSLQLYDTKISDEGEYRYYIRTNLYQDEESFTIRVTAKYSEPIMSSEQKEIMNDGPADLYCTTNGGYPAGTIHWFDQSNTNWTKSATLETTRGDDGLFTLSSKLSFRRIDSLWAPFRCVVLNNKYKEEGGITWTLEIKDNPEKDTPAVDSAVRNSIAAVVVIGSLIVGLLIILLLKRRRVRRNVPTEHYYAEEEKVAEKENIAV